MCKTLQASINLGAHWWPKFKCGFCLKIPEWTVQKHRRPWKSSLWVLWSRVLGTSWVLVMKMSVLEFLLLLLMSFKCWLPSLPLILNHFHQSTVLNNSTTDYFWLWLRATESWLPKRHKELSFSFCPFLFYLLTIFYLQNYSLFIYDAALRILIETDCAKVWCWPRSRHYSLSSE